MIELCICGFQTGADIGGIKAAKACGIPTGGFIPRGYRTEAGPRPDYADLYGAREHKSAQYPGRTRSNLKWCDALVWFGNPRSPGGLLTLGLEEEQAIPTPVAIIHSNEPGEMTPSDLAEWLKIHDPKVLMLAGNRESSSPGIGEMVEKFMGEVFAILRETPS